MRREEIFKILEERPIITTTLLANITGKSPEYTNQLIHRWVSKKRITRIERGKYTIQKDPFLFSSSITWPSYLSIWNSLSYHNLTEQIPHSFWLVTTKYRKNTVIDVMNAQVFFIRVNPSQFFGYEKIVKDGIEIFMADAEKAIVDCLLFKKVSVMELQEIIRNGSKKINKQKLVEYSVRTQSVALTKRIGYILDKIGYDVFPRLKNKLYDQITILEPNLPDRGMIDHKWKIKDNVGM